MSSLYVIRGKDNGTHFPIRGQTASLGRGATSTIRLNDTEVSRLHATIAHSNDQHEIIDNDSSNGTFVNSRRIRRQVLASGDRIQIGRTLLIYTGGPEPHDSSRISVAAPTTADQAVEVVTGDAAAELSRITGSLESRPSVSSDSVIQPIAAPIGGPKPHSAPSSAPQSPPQSGTGEIRSSETLQSAGPGIGSSPKSASRLDAPSSAGRIAQPHESIPARSSPQLASVGKTPESDWETVFQVSQAVRRTVDLNDLLSQILELILQSIPCDRGCILMFDDVTGHLRPSCSRDRKTDQAHSKGATPLKISQTILDHVMQHREGVLTSNAQDDERWENVESIANIGINEAICVPMLGRYGLVGTVYVDTTQTAGSYATGGLQATFDKRQLRLLMAIANQAALAVEDTQFYQAMLQSERLAAMGQTIANLSHHVKNVLQGIQGGAFLVDDGLKKENLDVITRGWAIVQRNQDRIGNLVMDMLSFSKDRQPEPQRTDLGAFAADIVESLMLKAEEQGVSLQIEAPDEHVEADFDNEGMHRALLNVVLNAVEATSNSESEVSEVEIRVCSDPASRCVNVMVRDNGPGIEEEHLPKIFAPFESSKGARGTGLGLPVSRKVLREHGGDITVKSSIGSGTTFTLTWPQFSASNPSDGH